MLAALREWSCPSEIATRNHVVGRRLTWTVATPARRAAAACPTPARSAFRGQPLSQIIRFEPARGPGGATRALRAPPPRRLAVGEAEEEQDGSPSVRPGAGNGGPWRRALAAWLPPWPSVLSGSTCVSRETRKTEAKQREIVSLAASRRWAEPSNRGRAPNPWKHDFSELTDCTIGLRVGGADDHRRPHKGWRQASSRQDRRRHIVQDAESSTGDEHCGLRREGNRQVEIRGRVREGREHAASCLNHRHIPRMRANPSLDSRNGNHRASLPRRDVRTDRGGKLVERPDDWPSGRRQALRVVRTVVACQHRLQANCLEARGGRTPKQARRDLGLADLGAGPQNHQHCLTHGRPGDFGRRH